LVLYFIFSEKIPLTTYIKDETNTITPILSSASSSIKLTGGTQHIEEYKAKNCEFSIANLPDI